MFAPPRDVLRLRKHTTTGDRRQRLSYRGWHANNSQRDQTMVDDEPGQDIAELSAVIANGLPDPCFVINRGERVTCQNAVAVRLFGTISADRPITLLLRVPEVADAIEVALSDGTPAMVRYDEAVPAERNFDVRILPLGGPPPEAALIVLRDLTEAQQVERMRADFVANASHELRTPLASLAGFIETLQGPAKNDPQATERFLQVMAEQAQRMSRLVGDLMSLSQIELKAHVMCGPRTAST